LAILARDVAEYYASCALVSVLPVSFSCDLNSFGIITRKDGLLSPASCVVCEALEAAVAGTDRTERRVASMNGSGYARVQRCANGIASFVGRNAGGTAWPLLSNR